MAEKFTPDTTLSPKELAKHLRQPDGETGRQIGLRMNKGNRHICLNSYKVLKPYDGNHILEIGMGNGFFIKDLLAMGENLKYRGVDFSTTMVAEANLLNSDLIDKGVVEFKQASIEELPFPDHSFDCITTTNTLYFWPKPEQNILELLRVLKPGGKLLIAYRSKSFMEQLEFTQYGFEKYEYQDLEDLLENVGFDNISTQVIKEPAIEFEGNTFQMEGVYTTAVK